MPSSDAATVNLLDDTILDDVSKKGQEWYRILKPELEPLYNGKTVAILLDTGDYVIGENSPDAMRLLRRQHPNGLMVTLPIGPDQMDQFAYRLLGHPQQAKTQK
jgi:predicted phosphoribosyltransferase